MDLFLTMNLSLSLFLCLSGEFIFCSECLIKELISSCYVK